MEEFHKLCESIENDWNQGLYETYEEALTYMKDHIEWGMTNFNLTQAECLDVIYMNN